MRPMLSLVVVLAIAAPAAAQPPAPTVPPTTPPQLEAWLVDAGLLADHAVDTTINPFYLRGDLDGDGKPDYVVGLEATVRDRSLPDRPRLIAVLAPRSKKAKARIVDFPHDDTPTRDGWHLHGKKTKVEVGATGGKPPKLVGDAVMIWKADSSSALVYWDGKKLATYWQGD